MDPREEAPPLAIAERALRSGDFGLARKTLLRLLAESKSDAERNQADALLDRLRPDPVALVLFLVCLSFFVILIAITR